jgi:hypothetical protein
VPIFAEHDPSFSLAVVAEGVLVAAGEVGRRLVPTWAELKAVDGLAAAVAIYARALASLTLAAVAAGAGATLLCTLALAPALLFSAAFVVVGVSTPLLLATALSAATAKLLPATAAGRGAAFAALAVAYPGAPLLSLAVCGGLLVATAFFPLVYLLAVAAAAGAALSARAAALLGVANQRRAGVAALLAAPALGPNFVVAYVLILPLSLLSALLWVPAVAIQTWLLAFPALAALLVLRSDAASALAAPPVAAARGLAGGASARLSTLARDWALRVARHAGVASSAPPLD